MTETKRIVITKGSTSNDSPIIPTSLALLQVESAEVEITPVLELPLSATTHFPEHGSADASKLSKGSTYQEDFSAKATEIPELASEVNHSPEGPEESSVSSVGSVESGQRPSSVVPTIVQEIPTSASVLPDAAGSSLYPVPNTDYYEGSAAVLAPRFNAASILMALIFLL